jgi:hypothetical protein
VPFLFGKRRPDPAAPTNAGSPKLVRYCTGRRPVRLFSYKNLRYLLLKAKRMAVTNVEFLAVQRVKKAA